MATFQDSIELYTRELETDDISTAQLGILIADTINEWVEKAPIELLYKHSIESLTIPNEGVAVSNKKLLKVFRDGRICAVKDFEKHDMFTDSGSIHYASKYTPVCYIEALGATEVTGDIVGPHLKIFPLLENAETAKGYFFTYQTTISPTLETTSVPGVPPRMAPLIVLSVTEKVLAHKLGMMIHEEEDSEVSQIIEKQLQFVRVQIQEQAQRLGIGEPMAGKLHMYTKGQQ